MAASVVDIYNMALTYLGANRVSSTTENSKNARTISDVYDMVRQGELRKKPSWNFAIKTAELAASGTDPLFGKSYSYPLPADFIAMHGSYPEMNYNDKDWVIQNGQIYTNYTAPLQIRYVSDVTEIATMDPLFRVAFASQLALVCGEAITQSGSKIATCGERYKETIAEAKKSNAFDNVSVEMPMDDWWTVRM